MAERSSTPLAMLSEFCSAEHLEALVRQTGVVRCASTMTGKISLALVTFGVWRKAQTMLVQWAVKVPHVSQRLAVSPEALHQYINKRALAFFQELLCQALAKIQ
jgi:hypothetical protein